MKVLIACEESQEVCKAFRAKGHEAYSCDIQMCSGGHPEWHICNDVLDIINGNTDFFACDDVRRSLGNLLPCNTNHPFRSGLKSRYQAHVYL